MFCLFRTDVWVPSSGVSLPSQSPHGQPSTETTALGAHRTTTKTEVASCRQVVLGRGSAVLVWLEAVADPGEHGDRRALASCWVSTVLVLPLTPPDSSWKIADRPHGNLSTFVKSDV